MQVKMKGTYNWLRCILKLTAVAAVMLLSLVAAAALNADTVYADDWKVDGGVKWKIEDGTLYIEPAGESTAAGSTSGVMTDYENYPTTSSGTRPGWTNDYSSVTSIIIGDGVTHIGNRAFGSYQSKQLTDQIQYVELGSDVTSIGNRAFANVTIPELRIYSTSLVADNISPMAFFSATDDSKVCELRVKTVECFPSSVSDYFESYKNADVPVSSGESQTYELSTVNVYKNYFNLKVANLGLLDDDKHITIQWDKTTGSIDAADDKSDTSILNLYKAMLGAFKTAGYTVDDKLKMFSITKDEVADTVNRDVTVTVPIPKDWQSKAGSVTLYKYVAGTDGSADSVEEVTISALKDGDTAFTFVIPASQKGGQIYGLVYNVTDSSDTAGSVDPDLGTVTIEIAADYFKYYSYKLSSSGENAQTVVESSNKTSTAFGSFYGASNAGSYKVDTTHLKAFDLSAQVDGVDYADKINSLDVWIPIPDSWASDASNVKILTITDGQITEVTKVDIRTSNGVTEIEFVPPHFSPYAVYYAGASTSTDNSGNGSQETTTAAPSNGNTTTTTAASGTTGNISGSTGNTGTGTGSGSTGSTSGITGNSGGTVSSSGKLDNTPITGIVDYMWIAIPVALMLMGVGVLILARRKQKLSE